MRPEVVKRGVSRIGALIGLYVEILNLRFPVCESHGAED